jgi:thiol-disulfide isomerase/thioredoxin
VFVAIPINFWQSSFLVGFFFFSSSSFIIQKMSQQSWSSLLGETLVVKANGASSEVNTDSHLDGKYVLFYFSAHWCPPCRGFTPTLATFYENLKTSGNVPFEIVFVSSDKDQGTFDEYYGTMPWAALPFAARDLKASLSSKFKVSGIPTLAVLDKDGTLITTQGRGKVSGDPTGANFPWLPESFQQELGNQFSSKSDGTVEASSFAGKVCLSFALYIPPSSSANHSPTVFGIVFLSPLVPALQSIHSKVGEILRDKETTRQG